LRFSKSERNEIAILIRKKYSGRDIAKTLSRDGSAISREVRRNSVRGKYDPKKAQHKAYVRTHNARLQWSDIHANKECEKYVIFHLKLGHPPEVISGLMKKEKKKFYASKTAIYDWLYSSYGQRYCKYLPYKRYGKKKRGRKKAKRELIPFRVNISKRKALTRFDYEGDTVVSKRSKIALVVIHNPKTMYGDIRKVPNMKPHTVFLAFRKMLALVVAHSITFDNGQENRLHMNLKIKTYFCDPHAPWQKPGVENMNRFIRKYIPKKSDISKYSEKEITYIVEKYNDTPRKKLKWETPNEVMQEKKLFKNEKTT
jgi:IS30 family transposase